jgi:hypothetical protein
MRRRRCGVAGVAWLRLDRCGLAWHCRPQPPPSEGVRALHGTALLPSQLGRPCNAWRTAPPPPLQVLFSFLTWVCGAAALAPLNDMIAKVERGRRLVSCTRTHALVEDPRVRWMVLGAASPELPAGLAAGRTAAHPQVVRALPPRAD